MQNAVCHSLYFSSYNFCQFIKNSIRYIVVMPKIHQYKFELLCDLDRTQNSNSTRPFIDVDYVSLVQRLC